MLEKVDTKIDTKQTSDHYLSLNNFIDTRSHGTFQINTNWWDSPESEYAARTTDAKMVDVIASSFLTFGTCREGSIGVIFWPVDEALPTVGSVTMQQLAKKFGTPKVHALVGDHTQKAMKQLNARYPRNKTWQSIPANSSPTK